MNAALSLPADPAPAAEAPDVRPPGAAEAFARPLIERQLLLLAELAEIAMDMARDCGRQAAEAAVSDEEDAPQTRERIAKTFAGVSRAVRMTCALQNRGVELLRALEDARSIAEADATVRRYHHEQERKARIRQVVEREIIAEHEGESDDEVRALLAEEMGRVDGWIEDGIYGDLTKRTVREVLADIFCELNIAPDWSSLEDEGWMRAEADGPVGPSLKTLMKIQEERRSSAPPGRPARGQGPPAETEHQRVASACRMFDAATPYL